MTSFYDDVEQFNAEKFGYPENHSPKALDYETAFRRMTFMGEELNEFMVAVNQKDIEGQLDAMLDLAYFAFGTIFELGIMRPNEAWAKVHQANMSKIVNGKSKRGLGVKDADKPLGWEPPNLLEHCHPSGIILLDGPDGVGKTTLAELIQKRFPHSEYIHLTYTKENNEIMGEYFETALDIAIGMSQREGKLVIIDRMYFSEQAYSKVYRTTTADRWKDEMQRLRTKALDNGVIEIMCLPHHKEQYLKYWMDLKFRREEMYNTQMDKVYDEYMKIFKAHPSMLRYDMFLNNNDETIENTINFLVGHTWL